MHIFYLGKAWTALSNAAARSLTVVGTLTFCFFGVGDVLALGLTRFFDILLALRLVVGVGFGTFA